LKKYCDKNELSTELTFKINDKNLNIEELWENIDWDNLSKNGISYAFHGDLNFGNVIYNEFENFTLIDWREDFSGSAIGDLYYDLGKLYAGSLINFYIANKSENLLVIEQDSITIHDCNIEECEEFRKYFEKWIVNKNYDLKKIKMLAGLIILSMSPLHPDKFGSYLFYYSLNFLASVAN
jgi:thiamine kinase-like enzyme